ncbi:hypothetical protein QOZ83_11085 [Romboutsia sedimentorum]|nr:hypothetical protein [Romboutsia sedimentorum]MDK2586406.1 hypothetical protein [Romboutsia sedimentorum]
MREFILGILASLVATYIAHLCTKVKNHLNSGRSRSGLELDIKIKFKKFR